MPRYVPFALALLAMALPAPTMAQNEVLDLTPAVLDRFLASTAAEAKERARLYASDPEVTAELALQDCLSNAPSEEARNRCRSGPGGESSGSSVAAAQAKWEQCFNEKFPEARKLSMDYMKAAQAGETATVQKLLPQLQALYPKVTAVCGVSPQEQQQAENRRPRREAQPQEPSPEELARQERVGEKMRTFDEQASAAGIAAGKFTERQYAIVRERVIAFFRKEQEGNDPNSNYAAYKFKSAEAEALKAYRVKLTAALKDEL